MYRQAWIVTFGIFDPSFLPRCTDGPVVPMKCKESFRLTSERLFAYSGHFSFYP